jgi:MoaA/NifB/PqqE/SkfB family radical SAM enzyme
MHSDLFLLSDELRRSGIRTTVLTSGLLLEKNARAITGSMDDVIASLDGPREVHDQIRGVSSAYTLLEMGVRALHREAPDYRVTARCTVQRANYRHLRQTVEAAAELRLQSISFLAADIASTAFNRAEPWPSNRRQEIELQAEEIDQLEREIEKLIEELPNRPGFVLESPAKLRRILRHFRSQLGLEKPTAPRCNAPWISAVVEADGTLHPCFFHPPIGNIHRRSLREALNSHEGNTFRESLEVASNPICMRCVCSLYLDE